MQSCYRCPDRAPILLFAICHLPFAICHRLFLGRSMFDVQSTEMRYLDASAKPGEKHTYSIITVNGVGLKSQPSVRSP
jgi:hypothetical protein